MKISLKWLSELLLIEASQKDEFINKGSLLRVQLPHAGLEIGGWHRVGAGIGDVRVAQILEFSKHPNADKLNVCQVSVGAGTVLQIVCGAPNVKAGAKVALAPVGATLPGDFKIKKAAIRGVESSGMLCSERELGLSSESEGILLLNDSAPVGISFVEALGLSDEIWEVELTPDRADCLSHWGVAREVGRLLQIKPQLPKIKKLESSTSQASPLSVEVLAPEVCPVYGAQLIEGLQQQESPEWMRRRLESLGHRTHDVLVDITNYVLQELGHPLHAFDADRVVGSQIQVRWAVPGEILVTLDGERRTLSAEDLVIADSEKPLALAGVMGGLESAVGAHTKRIILESAVFDESVVRAMAKRHKLPSEASHRFERGVDATGAARAAGRAVGLFEELAGGRCQGGRVERLSKGAEKRLTPQELSFDVRKFRDVVGLEVSAELVIQAFQSVGLEAVSASSSQLKVRVPTFRLDLTREIDLVEEAARLIGFAQIPERDLPQSARALSQTGDVASQWSRSRRRLLETGLVEMMPYSFIGASEARWVPDVSLVTLENPLSSDWDSLRPNLSFGLLKVVARQAAFGQLRGGFFDTGSAFESRSKPLPFQGRDTGCRESWHAAWALMGPRQSDHWSSDKTASDRKASVDFFDAKGIAETYLQGLSGIDSRWSSLQYIRLEEGLANPGIVAQLSGEAAWIPSQLLHPGRTALMVIPGKPPGLVVGFIGELHPAQKRDLLNLPAGFQLGVAFGELRVFGDLNERLQQKETTLARVLPGKITPGRKLPLVERDVALVVPADFRAGDLEKTFRRSLGAELIDVICLDRFVLADGQVSLAWRFVLQGIEKTLSDSEISVFVETALQAAKSKHGVKLRE